MMKLDKHIGRTVVLIYEDSKGIITQRRVTVSSVAGDTAKVFDHDKRQPRTLSVERVLACRPAKSYVG
ncbi:hypothetical protein [Cohnella sp. GbtcB17]|uniref:hypothetical protein n=1 Tax=Cohnella sp. GbtcB17 TaxID=2824762 RepID=UPI001C30E9B1|nr:hypothetical protein [Cohnella sp. GbtcB17]